MPICQSCDTRWKWKETLKTSLTLSYTLTCSYCKQTQYYSSRYRKISVLMTLFIPFIIMMGNLLFGPSFIAIIALLGLLPLYIVISPFLIQLSSEENLP